VHTASVTQLVARRHGVRILPFKFLSEEEEKRAVHVIFLQTTIQPDDEICAKGLNQVRNAILAKWKRGEELDYHYHYVLVLLTDDKQCCRYQNGGASYSVRKSKRKTHRGVRTTYGSTSCLYP